MKSKEKESDIVRAIGDYLARKKNIFFFRLNNSGVATKGVDGAYFFRRMAAYSVKGTPDYVVIHDGKFIGLEVKKKGGVQSPDQKEFEKNVKSVSGEYWIVRSIDDVIEIGL